MSLVQIDSTFQIRWRRLVTRGTWNAKCYRNSFCKFDKWQNRWRLKHGWSDGVDCSVEKGEYRKPVWTRKSKLQPANSEIQNARRSEKFSNYPRLREGKVLDKTRLSEKFPNSPRFLTFNRRQRRFLPLIQEKKLPASKARNRIILFSVLSRHHNKIFLQFSAANQIAVFQAHAQISQIFSIHKA